MKLSVIVPIYNSEKFLKKCIDSIINQRLESMEIFLINDGSKDKSLKICEEYEDERIRIINNSNKGCSYSRNLGIQLSRGEYIMFIDSDDYYIQDQFLKKIIKIMDMKKLDLLEFGYNKVLSNGLIQCNKPKKSNSRISFSRQSHFFNNPWNKVYRRDLIIKNNIKFPENCHMGEDLAFNFKYLNFVTNINILNDIYYNYFENNQGATFSFEKRIQIYKAFDDVIEYYEKFGLKLPFQELKKYYRINAIRGIYFNLSNLWLQKKISRKQLLVNLKLLKIEQFKKNKFFQSNFIFENFYGIFRIKFIKIFNLLKKIKLKYLGR